LNLTPKEFSVFDLHDQTLLPECFALLRSVLLKHILVIMQELNLVARFRMLIMR
jgi:hypothetical protein